MDLIQGRPSCSTNLNHSIGDEDVLVDIVDNEEDERHLQRQDSNIFRGIDMEMPSTSSVSKMPNVDDIHHTPPMVFPNDDEFGMLNANECSYDVFDRDFPDGSADFYDRDFVFQGSNFEFSSLDRCSSEDHLICERCEGRPVFNSRETFNNHCQQYHGGLVAICACPEPTCSVVLSSVSAVKRHLTADHKLPLETHFKKFDNIIDFNEWLVFVQYSTDSRFVMHNRQQPRRRQLLFCACSDHRKVSNNINGMLKAKGCCPSHINYTINNDETVDVVYQMFHYGHNEKLFEMILARKPWSLPKASRSRANFPPKPLVIGCRPMQYVQIDIVAMLETKYREDAKYSCALLVTDLFSKFMFARSLINDSENNQKRMMARLLMEIFSAFGVPEAYSSVFGKNLIDDCMGEISNSFCVEIPSVCTTTPCYSAFRKNVEIRAEFELGDPARWPQALPSTILAHNQTPHAIFQYRISPFEVMFGRRAWYKTHADNSLPWLHTCADSPEKSDFNRSKENGEFAFRHHNPTVPILDAAGRPLEGLLLEKMQKIISVIEARCDNWNEVTAANSDHECSLTQRIFGIHHAFVPGDYVYVRLLNIPCEKDGCLKGLIAEAKFDSTNHFPYRVHVQDGRVCCSKNSDGLSSELPSQLEDSSWPIPEDQSFWVSPYDLCASSLELEIKRQPHFGQNLESLYCRCSPNCPLFKSENCPFQLSKRCCDEKCRQNYKQCAFHSFYDSSAAPVNAFVQKYSQNPERIINQANVQRQAALARQRMLDERDREHSLPKTKGGIMNESHDLSRMQKVVSMTVKESEFTAVDDGTVESRVEEEIGAEVFVESEDVPFASEISILASDNVYQKRRRLTELQRELSELEFQLDSQQKTGNPGEEFLLAESNAAVLRKKCERLQKELNEISRMSQLQRLADDTPPPVAPKRVVRLRPTETRKRPFSPPKSGEKQQTTYFVEGDQVFPLVSVLPTTSTKTTTTASQSNDGVSVVAASSGNESDSDLRRRRGILRRYVRKKNVNIHPL